LVGIETLRREGGRSVMHARYAIAASEDPPREAREVSTQIHIISSREREALMHYRENPVARCIVRTPKEPGCGQGRVQIRPPAMSHIPLGVAAPPEPAPAPVAP
jgi:hypothetical protein